MNQVDKSRVPMYAFVFFTFLMSAIPGEAHLNSTGMGPFYDGLMHFLMSPEDIIPVLALALLAGLRGADFGRRALLVLPSAWLFGSLFGLAAAAVKGNALVSAIWFVLLGGLLAANAKLSLRLTTALAALLGLYHGYLNATGMGQSASAVVVLLGLVSWARIAVRVAGSWIAASGFLMLGWAVRTR
jgi:hydrogenase/urease accessory protein HupE